MTTQEFFAAVKFVQANQNLNSPAKKAIEKMEGIWIVSETETRKIDKKEARELYASFSHKATGTGVFFVEVEDNYIEVLKEKI